MDENRKGGTDRGAALYSSSLIARSVFENRDGDDSHRLAEDVGGGEAHRCGASGFHVTTSNEGRTAEEQTRTFVANAQERNVRSMIYGCTLLATGFPSKSSTTIGAIVVAASGPSIFALSPTIRIAR